MAYTLANCSDGVPTVVKDPPGYPAGWYPACGSTGVFYSSATAAIEDWLELLLHEWNLLP